MAKFGINDLIDIKKKESGSEAVNAYKEIWLNPRDVKLSESNPPSCGSRGSGRIPERNPEYQCGV